MTKLKDLEEKSIFILREAYKRFKNPAILWSMGKDSTLILFLCKKAFFDEIPFKIINLDNENNFKEVDEFRKKIKKEFSLDLTIFKKKQEDDCCGEWKIDALKKVAEKNKIDAFIVGIRRDEHGIRNKERYFSGRDKKFHWKVAEKNKSLQDAELSGWNLFATDFGEETDHVRIHPLLHWTELDIWRYIEKNNIPFVNLYLSKKGKRYRSIGCKKCCNPIKSDADTIKKIINELEKTKSSERDGRDIDKEYKMQRLRSLGYM